MDKIKYIKLEQEEGTYSDPSPLSVNSDYIDVDGVNLTDYVEQNDINMNNKINISDIVDNLNVGENNTLLCS